MNTGQLYLLNVACYLLLLTMVSQSIFSFIPGGHTLSFYVKIPGSLIEMTVICFFCYILVRMSEISKEEVQVTVNNYGQIQMIRSRAGLDTTHHTGGTLFTSDGDEITLEGSEKHLS